MWLRIFSGVDYVTNFVSIIRFDLLGGQFCLSAMLCSRYSTWVSHCNCPDREKAIGTLCGGETQRPLDTRVPTQPDAESDSCIVTVAVTER